jgi:PhnO protein
VQLRKAAINDCEWIYEVLEELREPVRYSLDSFKEYYTRLLKNNMTEILLFCEDQDRIGLVTLNKFSIPRYLGYGYEMEEFVIHRKFRGKGLSYKMIDAVKDRASSDNTIRKLIIKSNGAESKHIYNKALNQTDLVNFQVYLNKL